MDASACAALIRELYGDDLREAAGVLHVAAVWQGPTQQARVLRINSETPRSQTDAFVLGLARFVRLPIHRRQDSGRPARENIGSCAILLCERVLK